MLKIGLTGGIGSGKSFVSNLFSKWGSYVFDADKKSKEILFNNETTQNEIIAEFGTDVLGLNKKIDNQKLANIAYQMNYWERTAPLLKFYKSKGILKQVNGLGKIHQITINIMNLFK